MMTTDRFLKSAGLVGLVAGAGLLGFGLAAFAADNAAQPPTVRLIKVSSHRFEFVPNQITLKKGEPVEIELSTADVVMGFNAPDFGARASIVPGQLSRVRFTPRRTGTFSFLCDVFCGSGHEDMNGTITVVD